MNPSVEIRSVHLRVSDLARSVNFYARQLGFAMVSESAARAELATAPLGPTLLTLTEDRAAPRAPAHTAGLFHAALLLPSRAALGRWLRHAADAAVEFDGFSDHGVSEAIYLADPDGNGLEFYADRPREAWPQRDGELAMFTHPLALPDLLAAATPSGEPPLAGARWGHLHLRVTDLDRSETFYRETLGLTLRQRFGSSARFLAADGYHHHLGLNTWGGIRQPQPPGALGLVEATLASPTVDSPRSPHDPDGIALQLVPG